jgi:RNA polymerase sigma factor (sigma-70 family)
MDIAQAHGCVEHSTKSGRKPICSLLNNLWMAQPFTGFDGSIVVMNANEQDEYKLTVRARTGDLDALSALVERFRLRLFAIAYTELRHYEDAQDAVASALVRICQHIGTLQDATHLRPWMNSIVRNEARRLLHRRTRTDSQVGFYEMQDMLNPAEQSHLRLDVQQALRSLPVDQARAIALFYLANISIREIARRTGRPEGTIKSWLHYGRQRLSQTLQEYAPMSPNEWTAAIVSTDLESNILHSLAEALRAAGFRRINLCHNYLEVARLEETGEGEAKEFHLPALLKGTNFIILDEWIEGHSAFELYPILRAASEKKDMAACILLDPADAEANRVSVFSAWVSGFDLCLNKPVNPIEFQNFATRIRKSRQA